MLNVICSVLYMDVLIFTIAHIKEEILLPHFIGEEMKAHRAYAITGY